MVRKGSVMKLYHGMAEEYERRHAALWQELIDAIHRDGGKNYTIFHDPESDLLFEYIEIEDMIDSTISKEIGGIETRGKARRNFVGGSKSDNGKGTREN